MKHQEIVELLQDAQNWIYEVAADKEEEHVKNMLNALDEAAKIISETFNF